MFDCEEIWEASNVKLVAVNNNALVIQSGTGNRIVMFLFLFISFCNFFLIKLNSGFDIIPAKMLQVWPFQVRKDVLYQFSSKKLECRSIKSLLMLKFVSKVVLKRRKENNGHFFELNRIKGHVVRCKSCALIKLQIFNLQLNCFKEMHVGPQT